MTNAPFAQRGRKAQPEEAVPEPRVTNFVIIPAINEAAALTLADTLSSLLDLPEAPQAWTVPEPQTTAEFATKSQRLVELARRLVARTCRYGAVSPCGHGECERTGAWAELDRQTAPQSDKPAPWRRLAGAKGSRTVLGSLPGDGFLITVDRHLNDAEILAMEPGLSAVTPPRTGLYNPHQMFDIVTATITDVPVTLQLPGANTITKHPEQDRS